MKGETTKADFYIHLQIPTNPEYDFGADPETQFDYANPVTLNNKLIEYANASIVVIRRLVTAQQEVAECKQELQALNAQIDDVEQEILSAYPPTTADTKTLKVLAAYIRRRATEDPDKAHLYFTRLNDRTELQARLLVLDAQIDNARQTFQLIKLLSDQVQTHLSFVKSEVKSARYHP